LRPWRIWGSWIEIRRSWPPLADPDHPIGADYGVLVTDLPGRGQPLDHCRVVLTAKLGGQPFHPADRGQHHPQRVRQRSRVVPVQIQRRLQTGSPKLGHARLGGQHPGSFRQPPPLLARHHAHDLAQRVAQQIDGVLHPACPALLHLAISACLPAGQTG
jgi:hypothetical protein